ncbi:MAG TPA: Fur family transcriptional regulator [Anaerolineaceae bacterium]|nr:Fur family transcriptional regulator [Anaerolineaceae bacterium]
MNDPHVRFNELISVLKQQGFRMTPQRLELIRIIAASEGHPSALQIYETIKNQFPTMSQATVYNTLTLLKEMNQVLEIDFHGDSHYDGNRPEEHPHLVCLECKKILDADLDIGNGNIALLESTTGFKIVRSQISFFGFCPDCKSKS